MKEKVKCWEFFECNKEECPVHESKELRCWLASRTHCRDEIQGKFLDKIEMCLQCNVFKENMDVASLEETLRLVHEQFTEFKEIVDEQDTELKEISMELALGLSEVFEALKKISSGDPSVNIPETSNLDLITKLKHMVNLTAENLVEMVDLSHEFAMGLAEHFDALHRVSKGDLTARVFGSSQVELLESLKKVTNQMIGSVSREITERKRAEETSRKERDFSESAINSMPGTFYMIDDKGNFVRWNKELEEVTLYSGEEISKMHPLDFFGGDDKKIIADSIQEVFVKGKDSVEAELISKNGRKTPRFLSGLRTRIGDSTYLVGVGVDITERKRAEEALRESERRFRDIAYSMADWIWEVDRNGVYTYCSERVVDILGYYPEEIIGKTPFDLMPEDEAKRMGKIFSKIAQMKEPIKDLENWNIKKNGELVCLLTNGVPLLDEEGNLEGYRGVDKDITERKRAEEALKEYSHQLEVKVEQRTRELRETHEQLIRQEKLGVIGQLAGGVGHELRNPLGAIKNAAYLLNMALEDPEPEVKETLEILDKEVGTSEQVISSLLDFARPKAPMLLKLDVNDVLQDALSRISVPESVEVVSQLDETLPMIIGDPDQLNRVFRNLVVNAFQAMPEGGRLEVKSEAPSPEWVTVSVSDTGVGIPNENTGRIYEPLFTTKAKGIGLGLALSKKLLEANGGTIEVQSTVGEGTTFTVKLPVG